MKVEKNIYFDNKNKIYRVKIMLKGKSYENCFTKLEAARAWKAEMLSQIEVVKIKKMTTLDDCGNYFLKYKQDASPSTIRQYRRCFRYLSPIIGKRSLKKIEPVEWHQIFDIMERQYGPMQSNTYNKYVDCIAAVMAFFEWSFNRTRYKKKVEPSKRRAFTRDELEKFLRVAKETLTDQLYLLYYLYFLLGCRRMELLALQWSDVDFNEHTIKISKSLQERKGEIVVVPTKTRTTRVIPVGDEFVWAGLKKLYAEKTNFYVFENRFHCTRKGPQKPFLSGQTIHRTFKRLLRKAGLDEDLSLHSCRHTFATFHLAEGSSLKDIEKCGGWANSQILLSVYAHSQNEGLRKMTGSGSYLSKIL